MLVFQVLFKKKKDYKTNVQLRPEGLPILQSYVFHDELREFAVRLPGLSLFFFSSRRRHTTVDCDWSSDVCSSDLLPPRSPSVDHGSETANLPRFALLLHDR